MRVDLEELLSLKEADHSTYSKSHLQSPESVICLKYVFLARGN